MTKFETVTLKESSGRAREVVVPISFVPSVVIVQSDGTMNARALPPYGEIRIVTHDGRITLVETVTKEKIE
ncbi:XtrA/YqaO family protein [Alicyclobacillus sendaiensis]|uniref:XtrA/YqaO family protein n=1 Tax=Alicyclobacillus sendaiensis TaxID=192387 RepID=UPI0026F42D92|nr:XtrA/YqaO family protein [Alicyclobacillus sendaiensis]